MFESIFDLISNIVDELVLGTIHIIISPTINLLGYSFGEYDFNLTLFSDIPIISMSLEEALYIFFAIFYGMFFIVLIYKVTKKIIKKVFGVFKL